MCEKCNQVEQSKTIIFAGGGTAGHIFPAQAIAEEIIAEKTAHQDHNIKKILLTDKRGLKYANSNIFDEIIELPVSSRKMISFKAIKKIFHVFRKNNISNVIVFGGYTCLLPSIFSKIFSIPLFAVETNSVLGKANKLAQFLRANMLHSFSDIIGLKNKRSSHIGFISRKFITDTEYKQNNPSEEKRILILGSSIGTKIFTSIMDRLFKYILEEKINISFKIIQHAPEEYHGEINQTYSSFDFIKTELHDFIENIPEEVSKAGLVISRAGASTISDLAHLGKRFILIPNPKVTDNHQLLNSKQTTEITNSYYFEESDENISKLYSQIKHILSNPQLEIDQSFLQGSKEALKHILP